MFGGKKEEKKEEEDDKADEEKPEENAEGGDDAGGDEEGEDEVLQVAKTRKISKEQFFKEVSDRTNPPSRGDTEQERDHWSRPRRWQVRLWQVRIENMTDEAILVFGNFIFGGTKEEFLVKTGGKEPSIWVAGDEGVILRTPVVQDIPGDGEDTECEFDVAFEWQGSYLDLERQTLRLEIWNWARWRINKFDCFCEEPLLSFAKGPVQNEMECNKVDKFGKKQPRVQVAFKLFFQEIYDFELTMPVWRASTVPTCKRLLERLRDGIEDEDEELTGDGRSTRARTTRQTGAKEQALQRAASIKSDELIQQTIRIQTPALRAHGTSSCRLTSNKSSNSSGSILWDTWVRKKFRGYFRGTCSDLSNSSMEVDLLSYERPRELQELIDSLGGGRASGTRSYVSLANAEIPLRGVLEHGEVKANLRPAPWFYGLEDGGKVHRQRCGLLQGHVAVDNRPRYQQTDDVSDELDLRKRYLFVKIIKVDRVVTPDTRPTDEIDTFVEVTFDSVAKRTRICQDDVSPSFNDDLVFELSLAKTSSSNERQDDNEATWEELERKGPVFIDLWTVGSKSNEHLGAVEAYLQDILVDEVGQPQKEVTRTARDARLKRQETFSVRAFRGQQRLRFTWGVGQESNIFYEMWFLPDLNPMAVLQPLPADVPLPKALGQSFDEKEEQWNQLADDLNGIEESMEKIEIEDLRKNGRQFPCKALSIWPVQSAQEHFLPRFCDVLRPPHGIESATAICHYVGCFPYMENKSEDTVSTPNFFCALRKGQILEHALLHCSLLLGLSFKAYVCCGTNLRGDPHSWVAVFEEDGTVRFWEPFLGSGTLQLRRRFAHPQFLLPGKTARSLKDADILAENRRRRRMLKQSRGRAPQRLILKASPEAVKAAEGAAPRATTKKSAKAGARATKKSFFRGAPAEKDPGHEHDMIYVDLLDLGVKERPEEDRGEHVGSGSCAACYAVVGGSYFYRGFACPTCQQAGSRYLLCYKCAEPLFGDVNDLEDINFNVRDRFNFEDYNAYLGESDSHTMLPYRSVEVVFNNANIWMNKQDPDPRYIFWDLQNSDYWHPFSNKVSGLRPCFTTCRFPMAGRDEGWCVRQRRELLQELRKTIQMQRSHKNLGTRWVTSPQLLRFLEAGLRIRSQLDMEGHIIEDEHPKEDLGAKHELQEQLLEWETTLHAKTPKEYKLSSMPMHFNFLDADEIAEKVMELCPFLMTRDKSAQFAVACHLIPLPGEVVSIYLYACELHALSQMQLREEQERQSQPPDDRGVTVAQLMKKLKGGTGNQEQKGQSLATMIIEAAKKAKDMDAPVVEAIPEDEVVRPPFAAGEAQPEVMTCFDENFHSRYVRISSDALEASYIATKEEDYALHGGLLGDGPMPEYAERGKYFEVEVTRTGEGHPDGLCVGVTLTPPEEFTSPPDTMDGVADTWIAGYDGLFWDPVEADMLPINWNPASLQNGDKVGVLIQSDGTFVLVVNGEVAVERRANVPYAKPLFAVVDLLGSCDAVKLLLSEPPEVAAMVVSEVPPPEPGAEALAAMKAPVSPNPGTASTETMSGFSKKIMGDYVQLSEDGLSATYTGQTGHEMHGGLVGNYPLAKDGGVHFTVELTKIRKDMMDGLTLGVTTNAPSALDEMTDTIEGVQACWTVGYDGQMYDAQEDRWTDLSWHGRDLRVGDRVALQITEAGQMRIYVNGKFVVDAHAGIPCDRPLFALVDLIGTADGVKLLLDAPLPDRAEDLSSQPTREVLSCKASMEGWWHRHGEMVALDGLKATYTSSVYELFGGVMGDGPLRSFDHCWFFCVRVESIRPGTWQDGMALGVTTCQPGLVEEMPQTMDEVDPCWLMGFDGVEWDGAGLTWGPSTWSPAKLKVGDLVGVVVTFQGELQIVVNGAAVTQATFALPTERPLYAIVDLIGATSSVSLVLDAQPPQTQKTSGLIFSPPGLRDDPFTAPSEAGSLVAPEDVEFDDSPPASPQEPPSQVTEAQPLQLPLQEAVRLADAEVVPEVQVVVTKVPSDQAVVPQDFDAKVSSPRDDALGAVLAAQALATEPKKEGAAQVTQVTPSTVAEAPSRGPKRKPVKGAAKAAGAAQKAAATAVSKGAAEGVLATPRSSRERRTPSRQPKSSAASAATATAPPPVGFHATKHGKFVTISADGLFAKHAAPFEDDIFGGVLGNTALAKDSMGMSYFEVKIEEAVTGMPDGLAIGVTSVEPSTLKRVPEILDGLGKAWLVGFDGIMYDAHDFSEVDWYPSELRIGDRVGCLVTVEGQLQIFVNGKWRLDGPKNVDTSRPLYLALDLIGNTEAVSLLPQARCPLATRASANQRKPGRGFHRQSLGRQLRLVGEWTVEHMGKEDLQGTALGAAPLDFTDAGLRYFEVHIDEVIPDRPDGLAIGVTSHRPDEILEPPVSSDALRPAWLVGFDGAIWDGAKMEWLLSSWDTRQLRVGDAVGAMVDQQGTLRIFVNGRQMAKGPTIQTQSSLYPMVDLLGTVKRLSLLPKCTTPELSEELWTPPAPPEPDKTMASFHREKVGSQILLSENGASAQRATYTQSALEGGLVFGDAPLPPREDFAVGFSFIVTSPVAPGDTEGLALGVTTRPPNELTTLPATADEVDPSYLLGFDGAAWDGSALKWHFSHWQPQTLRANDRVDVLLEKQRLQVAVNGTRVAAQAMQVSNPQGPFYALIDLASAGLAVALHDVKAPRIGEERPARADKKSETRRVRQEFRKNVAPLW